MDRHQNFSEGRVTGLGRWRAASLALLFVLGALAPAAAVDGAVREPDGYRMDDYRAPVPGQLAGARVIDAAEARRLFDAGIAFVDVLPRPARPKGLPADTLWRPTPHENIPGSLWLVDTGYGALAPSMEDYLLRGLEAASGGDRAAPLVVYCKRDCWMSYNAAKRAVAAGYTGIRWFPEGTDAWAEAGFALEADEPEPRPDE